MQFRRIWSHKEHLKKRWREEELKALVQDKNMITLTENYLELNSRSLRIGFLQIFCRMFYFTYAYTHIYTWAKITQNKHWRKMTIGLFWRRRHWEKNLEAYLPASHGSSTDFSTLQWAQVELVLVLYRPGTILHQMNTFFEKANEDILSWRRATWPISSQLACWTSSLLFWIPFFSKRVVCDTLLNFTVQIYMRKTFIRISLFSLSALQLGYSWVTSIKHLYYT